MKSLFGKILLWFLAALLITVAGFTVTTAIAISHTDQPPLFARMVTLQFQQARYVYESGGRASLERYLERLERIFEGEAVLTDAQGRDLVTGEDRSELLRRGGRGTGRLPPIRRREATFARRSPDGQYWFFLHVPREPVSFWFLLPQHLLVVAAAVLLCYWLAYHLTRPVRELQHAVERFGAGDLSARAGSRRRDELGQLARTFDQMADRIQTLLAAERRLLGDISHELRSPLARLGLAVELARSGDEREAALARIQKEADRLNALVGELLQVTRAEGDPSSLRAEHVPLEALLRELVDDVAVEAEARNCRVEFKSAGPAAVQGDPELLRRAIENVLRNAIRYAPERTAIEVRLDPPARISVRDYGPGVPEEALPRIFDAFYRVESDRSRAAGGGVGLGLAIARRAVELHGGKLSARNAHPGLLVEIQLTAAAR